MVEQPVKKRNFQLNCGISRKYYFPVFVNREGLPFAHCNTGLQAGHKLNKQPLLIVEVDGFAYHENNPEQLRRDGLKNSILSKHEIPYIRFPTTGSGEKEKLRNKLNEVLKDVYG
ncbi:DUF2726 domain-containing protein [Paenibacillus piri]|uniref:DUF2726 domain-containing protein n=1 Tax=Paenibacillus piri TaxID=2547395 RepID=UPI0014053684|nr:DUF2726 domain-containing protein [Paenibacillus piri]